MVIRGYGSVTGKRELKMSIKITEYQLDDSKFQADVSYKIGKKVIRKRWLVPTSVYSTLTAGKKEKACENWAQAKLVDLLSEEKKGEITKSTTLDLFYPKWLEWLGQNVKSTTVDNYSRAYQNHIKPFWGKRELVELSDVLLMVAYKTYLLNKTRSKLGNKKKGAKDSGDFVGKDKPLAVSSKNNIQACLSSICGLAHSLTLIPYLPKIKFDKREKIDIASKKYTIAQQEIILQVAKSLGGKIYAAVLLGLDCGFRRGEVCAISWDRIFWERNCINVKYNLNVIKGIVEIGSPKGGVAIDVAMSSRLLTALRDIQPENAVGRIFDGLMPWDLNKWVKQVLVKANKIDKTIVISANFHKFRHNCASNLADEEFYVVKIKNHMRHASLDTTMIYIETGSIEETKEMLDLIGQPAKKEKLKLVK